MVRCRSTYVYTSSRWCPRTVAAELHVVGTSPLTAALDRHVVGTRPVTAALSTWGTMHVMQVKCYMQRVSNVVGIGRGVRKNAASKHCEQASKQEDTGDERRSDARASESKQQQQARKTKNRGRGCTVAQCW